MPAWLARFASRFPRFTARYLSLDPRSLGLVRIYLGCVLLVDLLRRIPHLNTWYTNRGPLPNHVLLWRPVAKYQFSLFFLASHRGEAVALFVLCGLVFALFTLGWRTRLMHVLSLVAICSLHNRIALFEDGSEVTTRLLTFWTVFLPMGARFSLDAVRRRAAHMSGAAAPTGDDGPAQAPAISLAVAGILLQIALLYTFNVLHKDGPTWRDGSAVHYVLHQDRIVTWLGWQLRRHMTLQLSRLLTYTALVIEALLPVLILSPVWTRQTRRAAIVLAVGLHAGFASLLNLGMFSFNMVGFFLLLLSDRDWAWLQPRSPRLSARAAASVRRWLPASAAPAPVPRWRAWLDPWAREATVVLFAIALGSQVMLENRALPDALRVRRQPRLLRLLVEYPRFMEGWSMFAPDAPTRDSFLYVDAVTIDGRHVDPLNELASRVSALPVDAIPEFLDQDDTWCDYTMNIAGRPEYHGTLTQFIRAYPQRTGRAQDRIVGFEVWMMEDESPAPGEREPHDTTRWLVLRQ